MACGRSADVGQPPRCPPCDRIRHGALPSFDVPDHDRGGHAVLCTGKGRGGCRLVDNDRVLEGILPRSSQPAVIELDEPEMGRVVEHDSESSRPQSQRLLDACKHRPEDVAVKRVVEVQHRRRVGQPEASRIAVDEVHACPFGSGYRAADVCLRRSMQTGRRLDANHLAEWKARRQDDRPSHSGTIVDEHVVAGHLEVAQHAIERADRAGVIVVAPVPVREQRLDRHEAAAADTQAPFEHGIDEPVQDDAKGEGRTAAAPRVHQPMGGCSHVVDTGHALRTRR
ncbi:protein of unknown function (plasmid) [Ralstonia solanacearum PSI07]|nr:protein of unknown function [Ralstonia solanacearum PSI07]